MRTRAILPAAMLLLWWIVPPPAAAQDWSVQLDGPTGFEFRGNSNGGARTLKSDQNEGLLLAVGTPYHVGFGVESYTAKLEPKPGFFLRMKVESIDVFVDLPVPLSEWFSFSVGTGWGEASFDPDQIPESPTSASILKKINLWQFFATLGVKIGWGLDVHVGYHEYNGRLTVSHSGNPQDPSSSENVHLTLNTLGVRYTF